MSSSSPQREPCRPHSVSDALIAWTSGGALVVFGLAYLDDAVIMGHTLLALGLLVVAHEALKLHASLTDAKHGHYRARLAVAILFVALVVYGFMFPSPQ